MIPKRIIQYHAAKYDLSLHQAEQLFIKLDEFLKDVSEHLRFVPTNEIDQAWHTFILHTKLYQDYCLTNFNRFIHHNPHILSKRTCDAGGAQHATCKGKDEEEVTCETGFLDIHALAPCNDGGDNGDGTACDAQLSTTLISLKS